MSLTDSVFNKPQDRPKFDVENPKLNYDDQKCQNWIKVEKALKLLVSLNRENPHNAEKKQTKEIGIS